VAVPVATCRKLAQSIRQFPEVPAVAVQLKPMQHTLAPERRVLQARETPVVMAMTGTAFSKVPVVVVALGQLDRREVEL
jgi:hypothetical protein